MYFDGPAMRESHEVRSHQRCSIDSFRENAHVDIYLKHLRLTATRFARHWRCLKWNRYYNSQSNQNSCKTKVL